MVLQLVKGEIPSDFTYRDCDTYVVSEVFVKQGYRHMTVGPGSVVLDLGAHVGSFTRWALDRGADRVTSVEMMPDTLEMLRKNVGEDSRVRIIPGAMAGRRTKVVAVHSQNPMGDFVAGTRRAAKITDKTERVDAYCLEDLLTSDVTHLKYDIETSEYGVLLPWLELISKSGLKQLCGEHHVYNKALYDEASLLWDSLQQLGFIADRPLPKKPTGWGPTICYTRSS